MTSLRLLLLLIVWTTALRVSAQDEVIAWDRDRPLAWSDFQAPPDSASEHAAGTFSGVRYTYAYTMPDRALTFEVTAYFDPAKSWRKAEANSDYLLRHEQVHFDISELHARLLRKAFAEATFSDRFEDKIKAIHAENSAARRAMQRDYDRETDHSNDRTMQQRWDALIRQRLEALEAHQHQP